MIKWFWTILLIVTTSPVAKDTASDANNQGMVAYNKKDYVNFIKYFTKAILLEPGHKLANYNLARVYALIQRECGSMEIDGQYPGENSDVYVHLEKAIVADPRARKKAIYVFLATGDSGDELLEFSPDRCSA